MLLALNLIIILLDILTETFIITISIRKKKEFFDEGSCGEMKKIIAGVLILAGWAFYISFISRYAPSCSYDEPQYAVGAPSS